MSGIKTVLVDIDGTLVDTNDAHALAWVDALHEAGHKTAFDKIRPLIGMGADQLLPRVVGIEKASPEGEALVAAWTKHFKETYLAQAKALPGAADLLKHLQAKGLRTVATSSGESDVADALLLLVGDDAVLTAKTTSGDAEHSKPAPDIVLAALEKAGATASETVLIGDTPYDIAAGRAAGVGVIALRSGGFADEQLAGAIALYNNPADLLKHFDTSPLSQTGLGTIVA